MSLNSSIKSVFSGYSPLDDYEKPAIGAVEDIEPGDKSFDLAFTDASCSADDSLLGNNKTKPDNRFRIDARVISDAIIGLSDGLTVPFALTAGLSALGSKNVVIYGGLAELTAGAISMGLGGYLGASSEEYVRSFHVSFLTDKFCRESYRATEKQTQETVILNPASALADLKETFAPYDIPQPILDDLTSHLAKSSKLSEFLIHFHHQVSEPASSRAFTCALTIALGYFFGGFFPLLPYFFVGNDGIMVALCWSIGSMGLALFSFGYTKTCFVQGWTGRSNVTKGIYGGFQMVFVGSFAAAMAMALVKGFDSLAKA